MFRRTLKEYSLTNGIIVSGNKIKCHGFKIFTAPFAEQYCWVQGNSKLIAFQDFFFV